MSRQVLDMSNDKLEELFSKTNGNFEEVYQKDADQDSELATRAKQSDLDTLKARVDNIIANPGESTEGNNELLDIRVNNYGVKFNLAGEATRALGDYLDNRAPFFCQVSDSANYLGKLIREFYIENIPHGYTAKVWFNSEDPYDYYRVRLELKSNEGSSIWLNPYGYLDNSQTPIIKLADRSYPEYRGYCIVDKRTLDYLLNNHTNQLSSLLIRELANNLNNSPIIREIVSYSRNYSDDSYIESMLVPELYFNYNADISSLSRFQVLLAAPIDGHYTNMIRFCDSTMRSGLFYYQKDFDTEDEALAEFSGSRVIKSTIYSENDETSYAYVNFDNIRKLISLTHPNEYTFRQIILPVSINEGSFDLNRYNHIRYEISKTSHSSVTKPSFFSSNVLNQNYFDDSLEDKSSGPLLRTDTIIWNQGNLGLFSYDLDHFKFKFLGDSTCGVRYRYFHWKTVNPSEGVYDFTPILTFITENYNNHNRTILRLFPAVYGSTESSLAEEYRGKIISYPKYVAEKMSSTGGNFVEYQGEWLLDINNESVYQEYSKLLQAFGEWFASTQVSGISLKDLVLYIDFGLIGPWGEGTFYDLPITTSVDNLLRYTSDFLKFCPDTIINVGKHWVHSGASKDLINDFATREKELSNNRGKVGLFLDNFGSRNPSLFDYPPSGTAITLADGTPLPTKLRYYAERGDFATGEFAMWQNSSYWGNSQGLWEYDSFTLFKLPFIKVHNMTLTFPEGGNIDITEIDPYTRSILNNCLSMVGFRFVMMPYKFSLEGNKINLKWTLINIGLNKLFFDIYKPYYRVLNLEDTEQFTDIEIDFDLCSLEPNKDAEPLQYAINNGHYFNDDIEVSYSKCEISLIIKDKYNIQTPLFLSNYGRQEDGRYIMFSNISK